MHTHTAPSQHTSSEGTAAPHPRRALHLLAAVVAVTLALTSAGPSVAQAGTAATQDVGASAAGRQEYKDHARNKLGGNATQFGCVDRLWQRESGWNPNAQNPTSSAYGIPQFLNSTWASTGIRKTSDPYRQVDAGLVYIKKRYGTPCAAWGFHQANNWY